MEDQEKIVEETIELLKNFKSNALPCLQSTKTLLEKLKDDQLPTEDGISLLDLKNKMFTNYLMDLSVLANQKLNGESIEHCETLERLIEERIVLEKIRPIENKLKYQIDKLVKVLNTGVIDQNDPLNAKPNLTALLDDNENEIEQYDDLNDKVENKDEEDKNNSSTSKLSRPSKSGIYVPPRVVQMKFEDEEEKRNRALTKAKKRAINSSIVQELRREFDDAPEEEHDSLLHQKKGIAKYLKQKRRYEEENFIRLNLTKKQKAEARKLTTVNTVADDITRFDDISVLHKKRF